MSRLNSHDDVCAAIRPIRIAGKSGCRLTAPHAVPGGECGGQTRQGPWDRLCIGASLLFLLGHEKRPPWPVQQAGLEWAWRLVQDPRRLARRYLVDSPAVLCML